MIITRALKSASACRSIISISGGNLTAPIKVCSSKKSTDSARSFSSFPQPFPYHRCPACNYPLSPVPGNYYPTRFFYVADPNFAQFNPGWNWRDPRFRYPLRNEYCPYPGGRPRGENFRAFQQNVPLNYGYSPNFGPYQQMRNVNIGNGGGFDGRGYRYEDPNRCYNGNVNVNSVPRNLSGRDYGVAQNGGRRYQQKLGDNSNERGGLPQGDGFRDQQIAQNGFPRHSVLNDGKDKNFGPRFGPDGQISRDDWSERGQSLQRNGVKHQRIDNIDFNRTRPGWDGSNANDLPQKTTINEQPENAVRQGPQFVDATRNENNQGSAERNWRAESQSRSYYNHNRTGVSVAAEECDRRSYKHENLNRSFGGNRNGFQDNSQMVCGPDLSLKRNGGYYRKNYINDVGGNGPPQESQVEHQNSVDGSYGLTREGKNMRSLNDRFPESAAREPLMNPIRRSAESHQSQDMYGKGSGWRSLEHKQEVVAPGNNDAARRCDRILSVLESEANHELKGNNEKLESQPREENNLNSVKVVGSSKWCDGRSYRNADQYPPVNGSLNGSKQEPFSNRLWM